MEAQVEARDGPSREAPIEPRREMKGSTKTSNSRPFNYIASTKSPNYLTDDICLIPGADPEVRIEVAPKNARRIFTGVDILADIDSVWNVLTNYEELQMVVPSLVKNEVMYRTPDGGARLKQVGGAKVFPGVTFTAKTVLDVNIYPESNPLPLSMQSPSLFEAQSSTGLFDDDYRNIPLKRGVFPRPYADTSLPHRDITMQNVAGQGDFEHYQGVWRMQELPNCAPEGQSVTRLTYAVEIRPSGILPVRLIEGRIALDLKTNMNSIRESVEKREEGRRSRRGLLETEGQQMIESSSGITAMVETISSSESSSIQNSNDVSRLVHDVSSSTNLFLTNADITSTEASIAPSLSATDEDIIQSSTTVITVLWLKQELQKAHEENEVLRNRIQALELEADGYITLKQRLKELINDKS